MRSGWLWCAFVASWLIFLAGCGSSSKTAFVYLVSRGSDPGTINAYSLNLSKGTLKSLNGALYPKGKGANPGTQPRPFILDPFPSFFFLAHFRNPLAAGDDN